MEKQSNSGSAAVKQEKTSISMDGQSKSPETSPLNLIWEEEGVKVYFLDIDGEFSLHNDFKGPWTKDYVKHLHELFDSLCLCLMDRGMSHVDTWIEEKDRINYRFVQEFGFVDTFILKKVRIGNNEFLFRVMRYELPTMEQLLEGVRD
jgi:hypothetical protein